MACHPSTVLSSVLFPMTSPHSSLYIGWGFALDVLQRPLVCVSPGAFFLQTFVTFFRVVIVIMSGNSRSVLRSLLNSQMFPRVVFLGHSCQPERLHRHSLAIAIAVASVSDGFISGAFHLQWCSHLTFVLHVRSCLVPSLASPFPVWLMNPFFSGVCNSFAF